MGDLIPLAPIDLEREAEALIDYRRFESDDLAAVERARERVVRAPSEAHARALIAAVLRYAETREQRREAEARFEALVSRGGDLGPRARHALTPSWREVLARTEPLGWRRPT